MKIIATDISNLTDARYFAAWGVSMMCYTIEEGTEGSQTPAQIKEIVDWVEGPETGIKMTGLAVPPNLTELDFAVENVVIGPYIDKNDLPKSIKNVYRICTLEDGWKEETKVILSIVTPVNNFSEDQTKRIQEISIGREVYVDGTFTSSDLVLLSELGFAGIVLKGGEEEKVGYKSFEELDEILEALFED